MKSLLEKAKALYENKEYSEVLEACEPICYLLEEKGLTDANRDIARETYMLQACTIARRTSLTNFDECFELIMGWLELACNQAEDIKQINDIKREAVKSINEGFSDLIEEYISQIYDLASYRTIYFDFFLSKRMCVKVGISALFNTCAEKLDAKEEVVDCALLDCDDELNKALVQYGKELYDSIPWLANRERPTVNASFSESAIDKISTAGLMIGHGILSEDEEAEAVEEGVFDEENFVSAIEDLIVVKCAELNSLMTNINTGLSCSLFSGDMSRTETFEEVKKLGERVKKYVPEYCLPEIYLEEVKAPEPTQQVYTAQTDGCYVATAVYGSYDCPQVWTLRRFRDNTLAETWYGRAFIKTYYAISPTLVKWFGETAWFKNMWKGKLDRMVEKLQSEGVEDTPYEDKNW